MGNAVKGFLKGCAKAVVTHVGGLIPIVGGPLASYINSKYAIGAADLHGEIKDGHAVKVIKNASQLISLIKANPDIAAKSGLTVDMVKEEVKEAKGGAKPVEKKEEVKATPTIQPVVEPKMAKGGGVKKARTPAQQAATAKMLAALKAKKKK
jgi:HD superfamily phosphodiesterase